MGSNMSAAYWNQWTHAELMSMHGVELDDQDDDYDFSQDHDEEIEEKEGCCAQGCMDCLGLSWSDFM